jgi:hypothetical protein
MEMEYVYGTVRQNGALRECLKTKGGEHTELEGYTETIREYEDCKIVDKCKVLDKYHSTEDGEGNCYDWYFIEEHYRYVDKTPPIQTASEKMDAQIAYTAMMTDTLMESEATNA